MSIEGYYTKNRQVYKVKKVQDYWWVAKVDASKEGGIGLSVVEQKSWIKLFLMFLFCKKITDTEMITRLLITPQIMKCINL